MSRNMWHGDQYGPDQDAINSLAAENADLHNENLGLRALVGELVEKYVETDWPSWDDDADDLLARARTAIGAEGRGGEG